MATPTWGTGQIFSWLDAHLRHAFEAVRPTPVPGMVVNIVSPTALNVAVLTAISIITAYVLLLRPTASSTRERRRNESATKPSQDEKSPRSWKSFRPWLGLISRLGNPFHAETASPTPPGPEKIPAKKMTSAKRIAEGAYGFIVFPAIPCIGVDTSRKVSKVFKTPSAIADRYKERYRSFEEIRSQLTPVVERLKGIDPGQQYFVYPEFCDTPGELTDDLRAAGVDDTNKYTSYLMTYCSDALPAVEMFEQFQHMLTAVLARNEKQPWEQKMLLLDKVYTAYKPFMQSLFAIAGKLQHARITHGDLHLGNILLSWEDARFTTWIRSTERVWGVIRSTPRYKAWYTALRSEYDDLIGYQIDEAEEKMILALLDELCEVDMSTVYPRIIDWDSAILHKDDGDEAEPAYGEFADLMYPSWLGSHIYLRDRLLKEV
jgi:hypothetical protein